MALSYIISIFNHLTNAIKHVYHTRKLNTLALLLDFEVPVRSNHIPFLSYSLRMWTAKLKKNRVEAMTYWRKYNAWSYSLSQKGCSLFNMSQVRLPQLTSKVYIYIYIYIFIYVRRWDVVIIDFGSLLFFCFFLMKQTIHAIYFITQSWAIVNNCFQDSYNMMLISQLKLFPS